MSADELRGVVADLGRSRMAYMRTSAMACLRRCMGCKFKCRTITS